MKDNITDVDNSTVSDTGAESIKYFSKNVRYLKSAVKTVNGTFKVSKKIIKLNIKLSGKIIRSIGKKFKKKYQLKIIGGLRFRKYKKPKKFKIKNIVSAKKNNEKRPKLKKLTNKRYKVKLVIQRTPEKRNENKSGKNLNLKVINKKEPSQNKVLQITQKYRVKKLGNKRFKIKNVKRKKLEIAVVTPKKKTVSGKANSQKRKINRLKKKRFKIKYIVVRKPNGRLKKERRKKYRIKLTTKKTTSNIKYFQKRAEKNASKAKNPNAKRTFFKKGMKIGIALGSIALSSADSISKAVDPLRKNVNERSITDTGSESIKYLNKKVDTGKKAIKTVGKSVKTTKKTIKTVKNLPKTVKQTIQTTKRVAKTTVKVVKTTVKVIKTTVNVTIKVVSKLVAALGNPYVLIVLLIVAVIIFLIVGLSNIISLASVAGQSRMMDRYYHAGGLTDIPVDIADGLGLMDEAHDDYRKDVYYPYIDKVKYDSNDIKHSDLMAAAVGEDGVALLATDDKKNAAKQLLKWNLGVDDYEFMAIAYVIEQKKANKKYEGTGTTIMNVAFTYDTMKEIVEKSVVFKETIHPKNGGYIYECDNHDCDSRTEVYEDPSKVNYKNDIEIAADRIYDGYLYWVDHVVKPVNNLKKLYNTQGGVPSSAITATWNSILSNIQTYKNNYGSYEGQYNFCGDISEDRDTYVTTNTANNIADWLYQNHCDKVAEYNNYNVTETREVKFCAHEHDTYAYRLDFLNKETLMNQLSLTEADKLWVDITEQYFRQYDFTREAVQFIN